jgi:hypothetical protein
MNPQIYTAYANTDQKAEYKLVIPVVNLNNSCKLEIRDKNNSVVITDQSNGNEFILKRNDPVGNYHFTISLFDTNDKNTTNAISQKSIVVQVLDRSAEPDAKVMNENRLLVLEQIKQVNVETAVGMYGSSIKGANLPAVWRKLNEQFNGQEAELLCDILEESHDFKIYWVAINFLNLSSQEVLAENTLMHILSVVSDHIPSGGHVQTVALQLVQSLELPRNVVWKSLLSTLKVTAPHLALPIVKVVVSFVPEDGLQVTSNAIIRVIKAMNADSHEILSCIEAIESINCAETAVSLREIMLRIKNPQACARIAALLAKWKDPEAASVIRKYLDANHETVSQLYILETMRTLYRLEGVSSLEYIAQLLLKCHSYVQQNIGNDYLGEVRYAPVIIQTVKEILTNTNDPAIKKSLSDFMEKLPNK